MVVRRERDRVACVGCPPRKGRVEHGEDDAANPQNWSFGKKLFVTGQVCFLTFTIYIGSAIYSAGELGVEDESVLASSRMAFTTRAASAHARAALAEAVAACRLAVDALWAASTAAV